VGERFPDPSYAITMSYFLPKDALVWVPVLLAVTAPVPSGRAAHCPEHSPSSLLLPPSPYSNVLPRLLRRVGEGVVSQWV